jgi:hypothetical protein
VLEVERLLVPVPAKMQRDDLRCPWEIVGGRLVAQNVVAVPVRGVMLGEGNEVALVGRNLVVEGVVDLVVCTEVGEVEIEFGRLPRGRGRGRGRVGTVAAGRCRSGGGQKETFLWNSAPPQWGYGDAPGQAGRMRAPAGVSGCRSCLSRVLR